MGAPGTAQLPSHHLPSLLWLPHNLRPALLSPLMHLSLQVLYSMRYSAGLMSPFLPLLPITKNLSSPQAWSNLSHSPGGLLVGSHRSDTFLPPDHSPRGPRYGSSVISQRWNSSSFIFGLPRCAELLCLHSKKLLLNISASILQDPWASSQPSMPL